MADNPAELKSGSVLIASPFLKDPAFARSVVLILGHEPGIESRGVSLSQTFAEGALRTVNDAFNIHLLEHLSADQQILHKGGPLEGVFLLISDQLTGPRSGVPLGETGYVFNPLVWEDAGLKVAADVLEAKPQTSLLALGYAGWGAGQLEGELDLGMWAVANIDLKSLFNTPPEKRWESAAAAAGFDVSAYIESKTTNDKKSPAP